MAAEGSTQFAIRKLVKEDVEEVSQLVAGVFSKNEPISVHFRDRFNETEEDLFNYYCKPETEKCAEHDLSFVCVDTDLPKSSQIIGYLLCSTVNLLNRADKLSNQFHVQDAWEDLLHNCIIRYLKLYPETEINDHVWFVAFGVKNGYEKTGIGIKLITGALNNAKRKGFKYAFSIPTMKGHMSYSKKLSWKLLFSIPFEDIEYKGIKYLEALSEPSTIACYNVDISNWKID